MKRYRAAPAGCQAPRDGRVPPRPAARRARLSAGEHVPPARPGGAAARPGRGAPADRLAPRGRGVRAGWRPRPAYRCTGPGARPCRRGSANVHGARGAGLRRLQQHHTGAGRDHLGRPWLHRTLAGHRHTDDARLDTWDGVEQVCDPVRPATFMQVTGDRYPLGVPAARRRGRSRPDHPAGSRPAAAALDRTRRPGWPEDHPHRELHLPRPAGVPLPGWADLARCLAESFAQPERVPGNLIHLDVRHARSLWSNRPFRMVPVSRSPEVRRGSRRPREPSRRRRPPRRARPRCGHGR